ncbi:response regulator transcription factor [Ktedonosporobacter rubrisoli]|uniref:Response regulator transcription factor n=1 Tax=Ktedonosporobacter rubrisoli TaxID=2509675 RepID=A0A4P6JRT3_KTERU|nr:response regulator transcription factor [Ktedonosporobacter rubrisoli]QBD78198.1 response regulator transcription factor [Ktedonosporobacter rubrisoli]
MAADSSINAPASTIPISVLLADDHDILRQGLKLLLGTQQDIKVVGEACTGIEAIEVTMQLKPDIVVMDISMAQMDGLEACRRIRNQLPTTQVLILTMHESEEYFLQALRVGAAGYLVKKAAPADLCAAVRTVAQGGAFLYPGLAKALIRAYVSTAHHDQPVAPQQPGSGKNPALAHTLNVLTPREMEVLKLVAEGRTNQEIADQLVLSIKTVQAHRANVMEKLELHDITHLVRFAIRYGLITSDL